MVISMSEEKQTVEQAIDSLVERTPEETETLILEIMAKTEQEQVEWSERLVKMENFRWQMGMTTTDREVVCAVAKNGILRCYSPSSKKIVERLADECVPNLIDPMTVLAIINVIRIAFPARDFVVQFPATIPFHDLAHHLIDYLDGKESVNVSGESAEGPSDDAPEPVEPKPDLG